MLYTKDIEKKLTERIITRVHKGDSKKVALQAKKAGIVKIHHGEKEANLSKYTRKLWGLDY